MYDVTEGLDVMCTAQRYFKQPRNHTPQCPVGGTLGLRGWWPPARRHPVPEPQQYESGWHGRQTCIMYVGVGLCQCFPLARFAFRPSIKIISSRSQLGQESSLATEG